MGLTSGPLRGIARVFPLGLLVMAFSLAAVGCSGGEDPGVVAPVPAAAASDWSAGREVGPGSEFPPDHAVATPELASASRPSGVAAPVVESVVVAPRDQAVASSGVAAPVVESVVAAPGSAEVAVRFDRVVHMRGEVWLETSGGPSANAPGGGSRVLTFGAGELSGVVEIEGVGLGLGAALRDIDGNDAVLELESVEWRVGDGELDWGLVWGDAPAELEGFTVLGESLRAVFTRPVRVRGGIREGGVGSLPVLDGGAEGGHEVGRLFRVDDWLESDAESLDYLGVRVSGLDGREVRLDFEQFVWDGFPGPDVPTVSDCVHHLQRNSEVDSIRLRTVAAIDSSLLTDMERSEWRVSLRRNSGDRWGIGERPCMSVWSEELNDGNSDSRNESFSSCRESWAGPRDWRDGEGFWKLSYSRYILELLDRPYRSLSELERHILRQSLWNSESCVRYYPQLFTGRWVPFVGDE